MMTMTRYKSVYTFSIFHKFMACYFTGNLLLLVCSHLPQMLCQDVRRLKSAILFSLFLFMLRFLMEFFFIEINTESGKLSEWKFALKTSCISFTIYDYFPMCHWGKNNFLICMISRSPSEKFFWLNLKILLPYFRN